MMERRDDGTGVGLDMQFVAHALLLGEHVAAVVGVDRYFHRHVLDDFQSESFETFALDGVVGDEAHLLNVEKAEYLCSDAVVALVGLMAQVEVGVHCVEPFLLEFVGSDFLHQTYASAFLVEVEYGSPSFFFDHLHCLVELLSAVASHRPEYVACGAG